MDGHPAAEALKARNSAMHPILSEFQIRENEEIEQLRERILDMVEEAREIEPRGGLVLIAFTHLRSTELKWEGIRQVYKIAAELDGPNLGFFATQLNLADAIFKNAIEEEDFDRAESISDDMLAILETALEFSPEHWGFALDTGKIHYQRASFLKDIQKELIQAKQSFELARQWQQDNNGFLDEELKFYSGHVHFALMDWRPALRFYESIDAEKLKSEYEDLDLSDLPQRMAVCKERQ